MAILKRWAVRLLWVFFVTAWAGTGLHGTAAAAPGPGELLILCYHGVEPTARPNDPYTLTQKRFVEQMEYLQAHGFRPISLDQLEAAVAGTQVLPEKAVLLSFDDGYRSYHDFVVPVLDLYGFPSILAIVGSWIEGSPPPDLSEPMMTWEQVRAVAANPRVDIVSHSYDLHKSVQYTPQGNFGAVVGVRAYDPVSGSYESETTYREKLHRDFKRQNELFLKRLGQAPRAMVWPYGHYNAVSMQVAAESGMRLGFVLDDKEQGTAQLAQPMRMNRELVLNGPIDRFIYSLKHLGRGAAPIRAVQVDLDLIYSSASAEQTDWNLGRLIDRLVALQVNTVFLQAFADPEGSGDIRSVYFHNRVLPVRADIFGHAVNQMRIRGIQVFAWMPTLSLVFEDEAFNQHFRVSEYKNATTALSSSWYRRLTPFSREVAQKAAALYEDLASGALISGILFQDDAYLTDFEDFHPLALQAFAAHAGRTVTPEMLQDDRVLSQQWMTFKTDGLIAYIEGLCDAVRIYRPDARFARNLYARMIFEPRAEQWFAQNYDRFLKHYDYVVVMAYAQMENASQPVSWAEHLATAAARPCAKEKTVFKLQTYDWQRKQWVPDDLVLKQMRAVLAAGIRHLAYYPDNVWQDKPDSATVSQEMSTRSRPLKD
jgi:poly-beta-1,6-N-acetyl-D-glucosamine N-deacetylase